MALLLEQLKHAHARVHGYCAVCGETPEALLHCGACLTSVYCGAECQARDWRAGHQAFCLVAGNGKRAREEDNDSNAKPEKQVKLQGGRVTYALGTLPPHILDMIARYLPKEDIKNFRLLNMFFATNAGIQKALQENYTYEITTWDQLEYVAYVPWMRGIWHVKSNIGLEQVVQTFTQLRSLEVRIYDLQGFTSLANLIHLTTLKIYSHYYRTKLEPLGALVHLTTLDLGGYVGKDITPLANLVNLRELWLTSYDGDITPLTRLVGLQKLYISGNNTDFVQLAELVNLRTLALTQYEESIKPLEYMLPYLNKLILKDFKWNADEMSLSYKGLDERRMDEITRYFSQVRVLHLKKFNDDIMPLIGLTQLTTLMLPSYTKSMDSIMQLFPNVTRLVLYQFEWIKSWYIEYGGYDETRLKEIVRHFPRIRDLRISGSFDYNQDLSTLGSLVHLRKLKLSDYYEGDIAPLAKLRKLTWLDLDGYEGDLTPLAGLVHLTRLNLKTFRDGNLAPLASLVNLTWLNLHDYRGKDIAPLANLVHLTKLWLVHYTGDTLAPLTNLVHLTELDLRSYSGDSIAPLANLVHLTKLYLNSYRGDIAPLAGLVNLTELYLYTVRDLSILLNLTNLTVLTTYIRSTNMLYHLRKLRRARDFYKK